MTYMTYKFLITAWMNAMQKKDYHLITFWLNMDNLDSSSSSEKKYSSSDSENENPVQAESKVEEPKQKSRQLQYYHRKTKGKRKRKCTPFREQENPSRQLKRYHGLVEACSTLPASMDTVGSMERMSETDIDEEIQISTTVEIQNEEKEILLITSETKLPLILVQLLHQGRKVANHLQIVKTVFIVKIVVLKRKVNSGIMSQKRWSLKEKTKLRFLTRRSHFIKAAQYRKFYRVS